MARDRHGGKQELEKLGATIVKTYRNYEIEVQPVERPAGSDSDLTFFSPEPID